MPPYLPTMGGIPTQHASLPTHPGYTTLCICPYYPPWVYHPVYMPPLASLGVYTGLYLLISLPGCVYPGYTLIYASLGVLFPVILHICLPGCYSRYSRVNSLPGCVIPCYSWVISLPGCVIPCYSRVLYSRVCYSLLFPGWEALGSLYSLVIPGL